MNTFARIAAVAVLSFLATGASAQAPAEPMNRGGHPFLKHLGLTDDQVGQVESILKSSAALYRTDRAQIKVLRAEVELALTKSSPDQKAISALVDKKLQIQGEIEKQRITEELQIRQIVGDDAYFQVRGALFRAHHRGGMGKSPGFAAVPPKPIPEN